VTLWHVIVLSVVQAGTEFIPISSSGHLVLVQTFLGLGEVPLLFDLILHLGTLGATVLVYYRLIWSLLRDTCLWIVRKGEARREVSERGHVRMFGYIILSTAVTGVFGILFRNQIERFFFRPRYVSFFILFTGLLLLMTRFVRDRGKTIGELGIGVPCAIGFAQALSMLPGVSRSGATISTGLYAGMSRPLAGSYSFLLSIPSILGATIVELSAYGESMYRLAEAQGIRYAALLGITGFIVSLCAGYGALRILLAFIRRGKLYLFSYYCFAAAIGSWILLHMYI
jgi:undecaprenyl-diphosphatase